MFVSHLLLDHFRSWERLELELTGRLTVLTGENAQGKTNILEAVHVLCTGRSHRTARDKEMIFHDGAQRYAQRAYLAAKIQRREGEQKLEVALTQAGRKAVRVNGSSVSRLGDLMGHMNMVMFAPEDLGLIREGPGRRRRFLDMALSQAQPDYFFYLQRYQKALEQRNELLKQILRTDKGRETLPVWEEQLAENGATLSVRRQAFARELSAHAAAIHRELSDGREELLLEYEGEGRGTQEEQKNSLLEAYSRNLQRDLHFGSTANGPHRDDLAVRINAVDARSDASQGQRRTAVLSMKLAELEMMRILTQENPILLLDDVFSELDATRRTLLRRYIGPVQTLITCVDAEGLGLTDAKVLRVGGGTVREA